MPAVSAVSEKRGVFHILEADVGADRIVPTHPARTLPRVPSSSRPESGPLVGAFEATARKQTDIGRHKRPASGHNAAAVATVF